MPVTVNQIIAVREQTGTSVALEAGLNIFNSLYLLSRAEDLSGLDEWVYRTASTLPDRLKWNHRVVFEGLHYAVMPDQSFQSFPEYIHYMSVTDPLHLRARLFDAYLRIDPSKMDTGNCMMAEPDEMDPDSVLGSASDYLRFLETRFEPGKINTAIEQAAYELVIEPPVMQKFIVTHMWQMWEEVMSQEWRRVEPLLQQAVNAFQQVDLRSKTVLQAVETVLDIDFDSNHEKLKRKLENVQQLTFVPSPHIGPYHFDLGFGSRKWLFFGIRSPRGMAVETPELNRNEVLVRMNALTDETRLKILQLLTLSGPMNSSEIMEQLGLSQSAASRHLMQLSATGYVTETRSQGVKQYAINAGRIEEMLQAVAAFLLNKQDFRSTT
jgi:DNA-binding transcriptional ArsR family regulator